MNTRKIKYLIMHVILCIVLIGGSPIVKAEYGRSGSWIFGLIISLLIILLWFLYFRKEEK